MTRNRLLAIGILVVASITAAIGRAEAQGFHCKLPILMTADLNHGKQEHKSETDPTIDFQLRVLPGSDKAYAEGQTFTVISGLAGMQVFVSASQGVPGLSHLGFSERGKQLGQERVVPSGSLELSLHGPF